MSGLKKVFNDFKEFITRGSVVDLAVGVIIGAAFTAIVTSLVTDVIMPPLGWAMGNIDFSNYYYDLSHGDYANLDAARKAGAPVIAYGLFINNIIKFLIVALAVFFMIRAVKKIEEKLAIEAYKAAPPAQEVLLGEIRDLLKAQAEKK